ncbi:hypothetical protein K438DRAFT_1942961 [Mycena galopus ATCC 62051]|nr:hypothetical protein K438DRAFT_1942961 [Mycena galopus ATCC 62051]
MRTITKAFCHNGPISGCAADLKERAWEPGLSNPVVSLQLPLEPAKVKQNVPSTLSMPSKETTSAPHTPRPPNAFLCFRSRFIRDKKSSKGSHMCDISRQAAQRWNSMSAEERQPFFDMALVLRDEHRVAYPDYKFAPGKKEFTGASKSVPRARPSRRASGARTNTARSRREPEAEPSHTSDSIDDGLRLLSTLLSSYTAPSDEPDPDFSPLAVGTVKEPSEQSSPYSTPRSDRHDSPFGDDPNSAQFETFSPTFDGNPPDCEIISGSSTSCSSPDAPDMDVEQAETVLLKTEPLEDFAVFCQWDNDFSGSHTEFPSGAYR